VRDALREALRGRPVSAHELSQRTSLPEKEVAGHLEHLQRSLRAHGERLVVKPAACLSCEHVFRDRKKLTDPGKCPACQGTHIAAPTFQIEAAPGGEPKRAPRQRPPPEDDGEDGELEGNGDDP
jgi:hypothetical protein